jgi:DNA-binding NtrC family response regulator
LSVATIHVPPLKERPEDIEVLSEYYLEQMNRRYNKKFKGFTQSAMKAMISHHWSGNVRELIHRVERAVIMATDQYLNENDLGLTSKKYKKVKPLKESKDEKVQEIITHALVCNNWNITHTAKALKITRKALKYLIKKYTIVKHNT